MQPLISIIIPTYNRSHLLGETLDSIIAQTYLNWECIVIDDGSLDYTHELMEFYTFVDSRFSFFKRPPHKIKGANACRNFGFEISNGAYVNWFDDDDIMHPEKLEKQVISLQNSNFNFTVCQSIVFLGNPKDIIGYRNVLISSEQNFHDYLTMKIGWLTQSPLWSKDFLIRNNYKFDEELLAAQEWEFHCRILNEFPVYDVLQYPLVLLRKHKSSITYGNKKNLLTWHYFLARLKLYKNSSLNLEEESKRFLKEYLLNSFKKMIISKNKNVLKAYKLFIIPEKYLSYQAKLNALFAILLFKLFNRGNRVFQKIKYK